MSKRKELQSGKYKGAWRCKSTEANCKPPSVCFTCRNAGRDHSHDWRTCKYGEKVKKGGESKDAKPGKK